MAYEVKSRYFKSIQKDTITRILGTKDQVPIHLDEMVKELSITFYNPMPDEESIVFTQLNTLFNQLGIKTIDFEDALTETGKVKEGTAIFTTITNTKSSPIRQVSSLYNNPIVGIFLEPPPVYTRASNQEKLDSIVSILANYAVHIALYIMDDSWTIYTMNGAIINFSFEQEGKETIYNSLVPKLTAQVSPPQTLCTMVYRPDMFDPSQEIAPNILKDYSTASKILANNGMLMSHASINSFSFTDKFNERIIRRYLDDRSGMSYGFLVRQLPTEVKPAIHYNLFETKYSLEELTSSPDFMAVHLDSELFFVEIPEVWVISTRSGCNKTDLDLQKDLVRMGLVKGRIIFDPSVALNDLQDCKPSYDTLTILAHAFGNAIIASLLKSIKGETRFTKALETEGASLFHWHGYTIPGQLLEGYFFHGYSNPSVSCSTVQSAIYTLYGKLEALKNNLEHGIDFMGDVHVEPHHGTNISSIMSLSEVIRHVEMV